MNLCRLAGAGLMAAVASPASAQARCPDPGTGDPVVQTGSSFVLDLAGDLSADLPLRRSGVEIDYEYRGYMAAIQQHVVHAAFWLGEGSDIILIDHCTGTEIFLHGVPVISPDRQRFAVASADLDAGYSPTVLQVWRRTEVGYKLEWEHHPLAELRDDEAPWGPVDPRWLDDQTIKFAVIGPFDRETSNGTARLEAGSWTVSRSPM